ncbi:MAG: hypothetical protein LBM68_04865 [Bacteroidales bacterium]|jgi:vacuolar-type H+-ATPase subunit D/Vma8|nr:hypothetical protein [Bacteroidales bacterium]
MTETIIAKLQQQIATVREMYRVLKEKNEVLQTKNNDLNEQLEQNKETIENLQRNYMELQTAQAMSGAQGNNVEAKQRIEEIVREIDECIALLQ